MLKNILVLMENSCTNSCVRPQAVLHMVTIPLCLKFMYPPLRVHPLTVTNQLGLTRTSDGGTLTRKDVPQKVPPETLSSFQSHFCFNYLSPQQLFFLTCVQRHFTFYDSNCWYRRNSTYYKKLAFLLLS